MNIGLIDVDNKIPNFALMRASAYHKSQGDTVEWAMPFTHYDKVYASKVFTFTPDFNSLTIDADEILKGGTGYDIAKRLPQEIEQSALMDYSIYPGYDGSIQFFSRGCIRHCKFCLVHDKEGRIHTVKPVDLNPKGKHIMVMDNNFFANPNWRDAVEYLIKAEQYVKLYGVDLRIMNDEQAYWLNKLKIKQDIHIAWDDPRIDLTLQLKELLRYVSPHKLMCYVLIGYNSTIEQDLYRLETLKRLRIKPFVMPYRDYDNTRKRTNYEIDIAKWANRAWMFFSCDFEDFSPRKGFKCGQYLNQKQIV